MNRVENKRLQIFSGSHHMELAEMVAKRLGVRLSDTGIERFANGEIKCHLEESVRGADVFIFQAHTNSVAEALMEQAIIIDAAKRASARHITAVCPFLGYARQDRKSSGREPITARLVIDILASAGANRIACVDLHAGQIQGFFNGPFDHLIALPVLVEHLKKKFEGEELVIVSPDAGRVKLTERYASRLNADIAIVHKRRSRKNEAEAIDIIGNIKGKRCIIIDDMIDTAGTMCAAAQLLIDHGAKAVSAAATHGIFSDPAIERIKKSPIDHLAVTNTLPVPEKSRKLEILVEISIVDLIADAIQAIFEQQSVSALFDGLNQAL
ncbi:MAG TPA: ribose-phosphate diphosphokinase [Candidatus Saccharimonadales bacterium]|nr:ribose-phosphate diphosphokinase [Candidatus Saccharimonadales bacterium]